MLLSLAEDNSPAPSEVGLAVSETGDSVRSRVGVGRAVEGAAVGFSSGGKLGGREGLLDRLTEGANVERGSVGRCDGKLVGGTEGASVG